MVWHKNIGPGQKIMLFVRTIYDFCKQLTMKLIFEKVSMFVTGKR